MLCFCFLTTLFLCRVYSIICCGGVYLVTSTFDLCVSSQFKQCLGQQDCRDPADTRTHEQAVISRLHSSVLFFNINVCLLTTNINAAWSRLHTRSPPEVCVAVSRTYLMWIWVVSLSSFKRTVNLSNCRPLSVFKVFLKRFFCFRTV